MAATLANLAKANALGQDENSIEAKGLPGYFNQQSRTDYGYAPGPHQFNMPNPNAPMPAPIDVNSIRAPSPSVSPLAGLRGSTPNDLGRRMRALSALATPSAAESAVAGRTPNLSLTPQQFKEQLAKRLQDAGVASDLAALSGDQAAIFAAGKNEKAIQPTKAAADTYRAVADKRGTLPAQQEVASNIAAREQALNERAAAVQQRGLIRGKSREYGIPRMMASGMQGGGAGDGAPYNQIFMHYMMLTNGDPKAAADLTAAHVEHQNAVDPIAGQFLAAAAGMEPGADRTKMLNEAMKRFGKAGANAAPSNELPGADPEKTMENAKAANEAFPNSPRKAEEELAKLDPTLTPQERTEVIKKTHRAGKVYDRAAADAQERKLLLSMGNHYFGPGPMSVHAESLIPIMRMFSGLLGHGSTMDQLGRGVPIPDAELPQLTPAPEPQYRPYPKMYGP